MTNNRRRFTRVSFAANAKLIIEEQTFSTDIIDVSLKGALVETQQGQTDKLSLGQDAKLAFTLTSSTIELIVDVKVQRLDKHFIGVMFESMDLESAAHLKRLVELNIGGEEMMEREIGSLVAKSSE